MRTDDQAAMSRRAAAMLASGWRAMGWPFVVSSRWGVGCARSGGGHAIAGGSAEIFEIAQRREPPQQADASLAQQLPRLHEPQPKYSRDEDANRRHWVDVRGATQRLHGVVELE